MSDNRCVCCGAIIPEGRQVCYRCERGKFKRFGALLTASALMISMSHPTIVKAYQHDMGTLMRDVNFDGVVDGRDASVVLSEYANVSVGNEPLFTETQKYIADTNEDGMITATDASDIITYYMNQSCNKPVEPHVPFSILPTVFLPKPHTFNTSDTDLPLALAELLIFAANSCELYIKTPSFFCINLRNYLIKGIYT